jgi:hypothetical protein
VNSIMKLYILGFRAVLKFLITYNQFVAIKSHASKHAHTKRMSSTPIHIYDMAHVLNEMSIYSEASSLRYPIAIYTTSNFAGTKNSFKKHMRDFNPSQNWLIIIIETRRIFPIIQIGSLIPLKRMYVVKAQCAFQSTFDGRNHSDAVIASISSIRNSLAVIG